jgi:hypothetical protein
MKVVKVSVANVRVEHEVRLQNFTKWLEKPGASPLEVSAEAAAGDSGDGARERRKVIPAERRGMG